METHRAQRGGASSARIKFLDPSIDRFFLQAVPGFLKRSNLHLDDDHVLQNAFLQVPVIGKRG